MGERARLPDHRSFLPKFVDFCLGLGGLSLFSDWKVSQAAGAAVAGVHCGPLIAQKERPVGGTNHFSLPQFNNFRLFGVGPF